MNYQVYYKYNIKDNLSAGLRKIGNESKIAKRELVGFWDQSTRSAEKFRAKLKKVTDVLNKFKRTSKKSSTSFRSFGLQFLALGVLTKAATTIGTFSEKMAFLEGKIKRSGDSIGKFRSHIRKLASETRFSNNQLADASIVVAKGGKTGFEENFGIIQPAMKMALLQQRDDLSNISEVFLQIQKTYEQFGQKMSGTDILDTLSTVFDSTTLDFSRFQGSLKNILSIAAEMNIPFTELAATLGVLSDQAVFKGTAGTKLQMFVNKVTQLGASKVDSKIGKAFIRVFKLPAFNEMSFDRQKRDTGQVSLQKTLEVIQRASVGIDTASFKADLITIFGKRGYKLIQQMGDLTSYKQLRKKIDKGSDVDTQIKIVTNNLVEDFKVLLSTISDVTIEMGDRGLYGALRGITKNATTFIRSISTGDVSGLSPVQQKYSKNITTFIGQLGPILNNIFGSGGKKGIGSIGLAIINVVDFLKQLPGLFIDLVEQLTIIASALAKFANMSFFGASPEIIKRDFDKKREVQLMGRSYNEKKANLDFLQYSMGMKNPTDPTIIMSKMGANQKSELDIKLYMKAKEGMSVSTDFDKREASDLKLGLSSVYEDLIPQ